MATPQDLAKSLFLNALEITRDEERQAYLDECCAGNELLRKEVNALLVHHQQLDNFLDSTPAEFAPTMTTGCSTESPATVIGPYKLVEQIGEGGMGTVWMAQQSEPVRRTVALKLIKAGMDSREVISRFEAERQALALMDHPNIAKVLDAGTTANGRPYFVMELVKGVPITRYCDEHHLTPKARLELFVPVCQAIQHAHQKGIIHRDVKPSNVLVSRYDGRPVPKVIDFGVAKAVGQPLTEKTLVTGFGNLVGTLEYMSPEQAEVNQLDIDTRSDIYSLGVLLYELLTGSTPFSRDTLQQAGILEMLRVIREQEPSKPSTKLSTAEGLPTLAANRSTEPAKLAKLLRGELDWIVMKALEKDRGRRYETANGFAADVLHYLADETVQACPPSALYRLRKMARQHKGVVAATALAAACLFLLASGALIYAAQQRELANGRKRLADDTEMARQEAELARLDTESRLYRVLLEGAAALRKSRRPGYRRDVWDYLHRANALEIRENDPTEVRDEVLACLGDPIGLDPLDLAAVERMPPIAISATFQSIIDERHSQSSRLATAVSADGRWLAIRRSSNTITLWDADGQEHGSKSGPLGLIEALSFSRDGQLLVAACDQGAMVLTVPDLEAQTYFRGAWIFRSPAIDPTGQQVATFDCTHKIEIWSLRSNRLIAAIVPPGGVHSLEYSADGQLLLGIGEDGQSVVSAWPTKSTPEKQTLAGHRGAVMGIDFSPDGRLLASSSKDHSVRIWNVDSGVLLHECAGHSLDVQAVKFSPDGQWMCSTGWEGKVILWDTKTGKQLAAAKVPAQLWDVDFDSSGTLVAAVGRGQLDCWKIEPGDGQLSLRLVRTLSLPGMGIDLEFQPGSSQVAVLLNYPARLFLGDVSSEQPLQEMETPVAAGWYTLHFDPTGEELFYQADANRMGVWNVREARSTYMQTPVPFFFHAFTSDSTRMAAPEQYPNIIRIFDVAEDRELVVLPQGLHNKTESLAWSTDGARLAVGGNDGDLAIWNLEEVSATLREFGLSIDPDLSASPEGNAAWTNEGASDSFQVQRLFHKSAKMAIGEVPEEFVRLHK